MAGTSRLGRKLSAPLTTAFAAGLLLAAAPANAYGAGSPGAVARAALSCTGTAPHACDEVHVVYSGTIQSTTSGDEWSKEVSMSWSISFDGTIDDLATGKTRPKIDAFSGSERWTYSTGVTCETGLTVNPSYDTQGMLGVTAPGVLYAGPLQSYGYQDNPNRKGYLVEGYLGAFEYRAASGPRALATPSNPDVSVGCDVFAAEGPPNSPQATAFQKASRPYALFSGNGTADAATPATVSITWDQTDSLGHHTQGQLHEQLTFTATPVAGKVRAPRRVSSTTTTGRAAPKP